MKKGSYSLEEWCKKMNRPELLALYDRQANPLPRQRCRFPQERNINFDAPSVAYLGIMHQTG